MKETMSPAPLVLALVLLLAASSAEAAPGDWEVTVLKTEADGALGRSARLVCATTPVAAKVSWYTPGGTEPIPADDSKFKIDNKEAGDQILVSTLNVTRASVSDHGNFTCRAELGDAVVEKNVFLNLSISSRLVEKTKSPVAIGISKSTVLICTFEGFNITEVKWKRAEDMTFKFPRENLQSTKLNDTFTNGSLKLTDVGRKDNGTYLCGVKDHNMGRYINSSIDLLVLDKPQISVDFVKAVGSTKIFFNWTVNDGNAPIEEYVLQYRLNGSDWTYSDTPIGVGNRSFVISKLNPSTSYQIRIEAKNSQGRGQPYSDHRWIKTLDTDPSFVPDIKVKGYTMSSITIGWVPPPENVTEYVNYYKLIAKKVNHPEDPGIIAKHSGDSRNLPYMFDNLLPATAYEFRVQSCSELTHECGNWSQPADAVTMDGNSGPPSIPMILCKHDNISGMSSVFTNWSTPKTPNGKITRYTVELVGVATFINEHGKVDYKMWGPKIQNILPTAYHAVFNSVPSNTNYTAKISAVTRTKKPGEPIFVNCSTPPSIPPRDSLQGFRWYKVREYDGRWMFRLHLPRVSERNGAICCYRVFLVKLRNDQKLSDLPSPEYLAISTYNEVHNGRNGGAYIAEMFTSDSLHSDVILGDGSNGDDGNSIKKCIYCASLAPKKKVLDFFTTSTTTTTERPLAQIPNLTLDNKANVPLPLDRIPITKESIRETTTVSPKQKNEKEIEDRKRGAALYPDILNDQNSLSKLVEDKKFTLDEEFFTNQRIHHQNKPKKNYNDWKEGSELRNAYDPPEDFDDVFSNSEDGPEEFNNQILKGQQDDSVDNFEKHKMDKRDADETKNILDDSNKDTISETPLIQDGSLDINSNYTGFVELLVHSSESGKMTSVYSDYFSTLQAGPDALPMTDGDYVEMALKIAIGCLSVALLLALIICLFQVRKHKKLRQHGVEMNTLSNTLRSFCRGIRGGRHQLVSPNPPDLPPINKEDLLAAYTERQNDCGLLFQQEFEMLPESFPDRTMEGSDAKENQGKNRYPDIKAYDQTRVRLTHLDSVMGSDYINANFVMGYKERKKFICAQGPTDVTVDDFWRMIWEYNLDLVVMLTNLEEYSKVKCSKYWPDVNQQEKMFNNIKVQHVGEKRYSDYIIRELKISKPTMSHSNSQIIELNGIKKNGDCSNGNGMASGINDERIVKQYHFLMWKDFVAPEHPNAVLKFIKRVNEACGVGRTVLVHCSAGVGRTGTLVALDCLIEQLNCEGHVSIFNTIYDLRRQRNFLVQSLKQYVFIYRSLLEYAQYGDSEITASNLKSSVDRLKQTAENKDTCALEEEFEKIKQQLSEVNKPCDAGKAPEHIAKNRNEAILPYDHNRVILAPIATKPNSTYINASFIEGYENDESYIITQDPLPSTIGDFWRLVSEQEVPIIVMLSELGDGKCPRYWDDDEIQYDHISVSYLQSTSCPYYTKREFQVTNTKNQERIRVAQFQYHGWPTVSGQVPEVTRGLIELIDQIGNNRPTTPPMLVHCNYGTDRSSMFVALSVLITQLRIERRVDISSVTRKLRTQRMNCLDTFLQYEFLHRAIVNYAELHNLLSDS